MSESFFNKVAGPQNSNFIKKRLHHRFFPLKFAKFLGNLVLETPASASDSFRFSACNFIKKETPLKRDSRCFSVNFAKFLRISFHRTLPDDCFLCLSEDFEKFFRISLLKSTYGNCLLHVQVAEFQPPDTVKKLFHSCFSSILYKTRSSHSKAFIYLNP